MVNNMPTMSYYNQQTPSNNNNLIHSNINNQMMPNNNGNNINKDQLNSYNQNNYPMMSSKIFFLKFKTIFRCFHF